MRNLLIVLCLFTLVNCSNRKVVTHETHENDSYPDHEYQISVYYHEMFHGVDTINIVNISPMLRMIEAKAEVLDSGRNLKSMIINNNGDKFRLDRKNNILKVTGGILRNGMTIM